jgi:hypothetical protein
MVYHLDRLEMGSVGYHQETEVLGSTVAADPSAKLNVLLQKLVRILIYISHKSNVQHFSFLLQPALLRAAFCLLSVPAEPA